MAKEKALGKGIGMGVDVLIPNKSSRTKKTLGSNSNISKSTAQKEDNVSRETLIKMSLIEPNKEQPRKDFNEDALRELADSIKQFGIIQPIVLQKREKTYEIIAGERRWRAAKLAGLKEVPAIVKEYSEKEIVEIALIENIQREDLNPIEEAYAYQRLIKEYDLKQDELADRISKSRVAITNSMRLLKLCENVQQMLIDGKLTSGHARTLISIEDENLQYKTAMKIFDESMSVRDAERYVKLVLSGKTEEKKEKIVDENIEAIYKNMEENIKNSLGTKVKIKRKDNNRGKIEIEYYSTEELERIYEILEKNK